MATVATCFPGLRASYRQRERFRERPRTILAIFFEPLRFLAPDSPTSLQ